MPTFTLAQLRQSVYNDLDGNAGFYEPGQVDAAINEGLVRINLILGLLQDAVPIDGEFTVGAKLIYDVPSGILIPMRVYYEGRELEKVSLRQISMKFRDWSIESNQYNGPVARWAPIGIGQFIIHPYDEIGGSLLEVQGIQPSTLLTADGQTVTLEDQWADTLVDYARVRVVLKDSTATFSQESGVVIPEWIKKLKTASIWGAMKWPAYYILKALQPVEGKGT